MKTNDPANEMVKIAVQVRTLLRADGLGVLGTIDPDGRPHIRWMATTTFEDFPRLYTLTSAESRKVDELALNPRVTWMFTSEDMRFVVNLVGQARIVLKDAETMKKIWRRIADKSRAYFLGDCVSGPGFSVLETVVEQIECTFPEEERTIDLDLRWMQEAMEMELAGRSS